MQQSSFVQVFPPHLSYSPVVDDVPLTNLSASQRETLKVWHDPTQQSDAVQLWSPHVNKSLARRLSSGAVHVPVKVVQLARQQSATVQLAAHTWPSPTSRFVVPEGHVEVKVVQLAASATPAHTRTNKAAAMSRGAPPVAPMCACSSEQWKSLGVSAGPPAPESRS